MTPLHCDVDDKYYATRLYFKAVKLRVVAANVCSSRYKLVYQPSRLKKSCSAT